MKLLLDTNVFLWFISADHRLKQSHQLAIRDSANQVFLSVVSIWEAAVKYALGRLSLPTDPAVYLPTQRQRHDIGSLPLDESSVAQLASLPEVHRDPFDRMLICQALHHKLTIVTSDSVFTSYPVPLLGV